MRKRQGPGKTDILFYVLLCALLVLAVLLVLASPAPLLLYIGGGVLLLALLAVFVLLHRLRKGLRKLLAGSKAQGEAQEGGLASLSMPIAALQDDRLVWYNAAFGAALGSGEELVLGKTAKLLPGLDVTACAAPEGQDLLLGGKRYTVHGSVLEADKSLVLLVFTEDTALKADAEEYHATRPSVLYFVVDTYDEILKEMRESQRAGIMSAIDQQLEQYIGEAGGLLRRVSNSRYVAVVEERHIKEMQAARFTILDSVRKLDEESGNASLSVGVGRLGTTLRECEEMAKQALDMALGRGGDQAAVNTPDGFEFYGGVSRSIEKRTKVKSRLIAKAVRELMAGHKRVLVMGHKASDMDSVGAAIGMLRFARICQKPAWVVIDTQSSLAGTLINHLRENGYGDALVHPDDAMDMADENTLLVVVDTHLPYLLESKDVYGACGSTVVIDHHRRGVGYIDDAVLFYHEPYASSASELVSEMLQYAGDAKEDRPTPVEAEALLAGIMLDTRTFSLHTGVRTFEASAYLRRIGARTAVVKAMFASTMDEYLYRCHLVSVAKVHRGCAVVVSDRVPPECEVVAPQAANDLLTIEGVKASFVAILQGGEIRISARSMGEVNVQLVMEKLGGGGHLTMAGAQLRSASLEEAEKKLMDAIEQYWDENSTTMQNGAKL